jgi:hypothetical protein
MQGPAFNWGSDTLHNEPYRSIDEWRTSFEDAANDKLLAFIIAFNTSSDLSKSNFFTPAQSRKIGFDLRMLSNLLIRYRYQNWTYLNDKEQYYIENIEWSLINYCTNYANAGISLYSEDATSLYCRITARIEKVSKQVQAIIDSRKEATAKIMKLGAWALKLGAAISSNNHDQIQSLLNSYDASPEHKTSAKTADPAIGRSIGINFSEVSDHILKFHYLNRDHLDSTQRSILQNMEITILNYNSNFGGLGIKLGQGETDGLMEQVFAKSKGFVTAMSRVSGKNIDSYDRIVELAHRVMNLGAALTEEDVQEVKRLLKEDITFDGYKYSILKDQGIKLGNKMMVLEPADITRNDIELDSYKLGRKMGLEFRNMASLLLKYRYKNWEALTKQEKYHLENLEFTLTNFNSDFAVFGVDIDPVSDQKLVARIGATVKRITDTLENETLSYKKIFAEGMEAVKLGAAILTENKAAIKKTAALSSAREKRPGNTASDTLARCIASKMRIIADKLLKQRYENWHCFTKKEGEDLNNIEWTLMNFASNFSVLGIGLDPHERRGILECAARKLDAQINVLDTLRSCDPADKTSLFKLGMNALKTGATLTTEEISSIKSILGNCNRKKVSSVKGRGGSRTARLGGNWGESR